MRAEHTVVFLGSFFMKSPLVIFLRELFLFLSGVC